MDKIFPDFFEADLYTFNGVKFKMPAVAMGIDDPLIVEIVAECSLSASNPGMLTAQVWAREPNSVTSGFITSVQVPTKENESLGDQGERLFHALNESQDFCETLVSFIQMLIRRRK